MGHKGVSKRKPPKPKTQPVASTSTNGAVSTLAHASAAPVPQTLGKGEAISIVKGGKKKSSASLPKNKKR